MEKAYLDNNATTRMDEAVLAAMLPFFRESFGNPSSSHGASSGVALAIRTARAAVAALIGARKPHEIVFTSGGTEANNTAVLSALATLPQRREIVVTAVEHPSILALCRHLEKSRGVKVHRIGVDRHGRLDIAALRGVLTPKVALVSIMMANNETGNLYPVSELAELVKDETGDGSGSALVHSDAVQAAGRIAIDVEAAPIDMLSLSAHKLHGPKGVGALYLKDGTAFQPLVFGGQQERSRRAGTENVPGIAGFGKAAEIALSRLETDAPRIAALRDRLEKELCARCGNAAVNGDTMERLPNTANLSFEGVENEALVALIDRAGVAASTGSACSTGSMEPSHVLSAMRLPPGRISGAVRFSLSRETDEADIARALAVVPEAVARLSAISPFSPHNAPLETAHG